jgi:hypothetical protein
MLLKNTIIYLIGFAGTGKYTIAKELVKRTGARLVDNHLINNPVFSVIAQDGVTPLPEEVWQEVRIIRKTVFKTIQTLSPAHYSFIFTNELYEGEPEDCKIYRQVARLAQARKAAFFPVRFLCNAASLKLRKDTPERRSRLKSIDVSRIEWLLKHREILKVSHPNLLTLDVSDITAERGAETILEHMSR